MTILKLSLTIGTYGTVKENINRRNFVWTTVVSFHDEYFDPFSTINCREYNIRASLLPSPIPLSGFNYQSVFLEPEDAKYLHNPLISKSGGAKPSLTSKTSLSLKKIKHLNLMPSTLTV